MNNNLQDFFNENDFDVYTPISGHEARFVNKLKQPKRKILPLKWMGIVASITLLLGFYLGSSHQKNQFDLKDVSPKMAETQMYFTNAINQELNEIERYRNLDNESLIEEALDEIEDLEEDYNDFKTELNTSGNKKLKIKGMINNYQKRLQVLQRLLLLLNKLEKPIHLNYNTHEVI